MSAYKELELAETERDEYEAKEAIKWECRDDAMEEREESCSMTYKEAIDKIVWTPIMRMPNDHGELKEALYMACNALEKADKYRWHDLRKEPGDLPLAAGHKVMVFIEGKDWCGQNVKCYCAGFIGYGDMQWYTTDNEYMRKAKTIRDARIAEAYKVIAWREIEPLEEDE